jgi:ketosteroid isomerase-like protein
MTVQGGLALAELPLSQFNLTMNDREEFLAWFNTDWRAAEDALHNGDASLRFKTWSDSEPVTLFGAWQSATDPAGVREVFMGLEERFSEARSSEIELVAADVSGDLAYTVHREFTSTSVNDQPRTYVLRVTQVYRREDGAWRVVHRHGDDEPPKDTAPKG